MKTEAIVGLLRQRLPDLLAVYAFGSRAQGTAGPDSDLDLAVLTPKKSDPVLLWEVAADYTRQDAAVLNIQRAYEAAIDMGQHVVRRDRLGVPQGTREIFSLQLPILIRVLETHLDDFTAFSSQLLRSN